MIIAIKRNCLKDLLGVSEYQAIQTPDALSTFGGCTLSRPFVANMSERRNIMHPTHSVAALQRQSR